MSDVSRMRDVEERLAYILGLNRGIKPISNFGLGIVSSQRNQPTQPSKE